MSWGGVINTCQCQPIHPSLMCEEQSRAYQSRCVLASSTNFFGVDVSCQVWTLCKAFRKWNGFGDDVIAEQPSHPCLVIHNTVCHVTPCVFLSSESWLKQCSFKKCSLCLWNEWIHRKSVCLREKRPQWFHNLHSKCTWSTVILPLHLHLSVCCEWREIWCATRHAWM